MKANKQAGRDTENVITIDPEEYGSSQQGARSITAWNDFHVKNQADTKSVLANFVASHYVHFGQVIQMASGTTLTAVMQKLIERQITTNKPLELVIMTTNLEIANMARAAILKHPAIFATQQVLLTGGELHPSLLSLVGTLAARGVMTDTIMKPSIVVLGAAGVSFNSDYGSLIYHYGNELETQIAYATRPTPHRIILFDHEKLNVESGFQSTSLDKVLESSEECSLITSYPDESDDAAKEKVDIEMEKFRKLLARMKKSKVLKHKILRLQFIDSSGKVYKEIDNQSKPT